MTDATQINTASTFALLRRLFVEHGKKHVPSYAAALVLMGVGAAATAACAYLLKPVLNGMFDAERFRTLRWLAIYVALLFLIRGFATFGYIFLLSRAGNKIIAAVQTRVFDHLLRQNLSFFQDRHSSEFMTRLALAANGVRDSLQVMVTSAGRDMLTVIGLVSVMFIQDWLMALISLFTLPLATLGLRRVIMRVRKYARRSFDGSTRIMQTMQETVQGLRIVKSFGLESVMRARMARSIKDVQGAANRMSTGMAMASPLADTLGGIAVAVVIYYGSWRVAVGHADAGAFFSFLSALLLAYDPVKRLARLNLDIQNGLTGARLIYEILDAPPTEDLSPGKAPLAVSQGRIAFENVSFDYRAGESVLNGLSLVAEPNMTTALVGPSGGGKSTIVNLIQRFYDPQGGVIRIDGVDIAGVDLASLRAKIAFVAQDVFLFRGTIRENIALGREGAGEADIIEAAKHANAHDFIMGFSSGYDTSVGEQGAQLSGGQRQRIAIARAILKNAPIILLDEPTAALDAESEREVQKALDDLRIGRTTLVVAHRLQTIINADRICVVEAGKAVEFGTHDELMARKGSYHTFFATQFGEGIRPVGSGRRAESRVGPPASGRLGARES